ncbi:MAG: S8 family serine peptidase [Phycisphaerae bacterium]
MAYCPRRLAGIFVFSFLWLLCAAVFALPVQPELFDGIGINQLWQHEPNLAGQGVNVAVICRSMTYINGMPQNDYRPDVTHDCLADIKFDLQNDSQFLAGTSPHATAVCSILFGKDWQPVANNFEELSYRGLVSDANAEVIEFWHFLKNQVFNNSRPDADVLSFSIGSVFDDWWTRGIEALAEQYGTTIVAGIGNGSSVYDLPLYPAAGSNVIAVGVVEQTKNGFNWAKSERSTGGPTEDNRCKPDIVAPGNYLAAVAFEPNQYQYTGDYSSFATPAVAGTAALLIQKAQTEPNAGEILTGPNGNCAVKAILMNTAAKLPYWHKGKLGSEDDHEVPLDLMHGSGVLDAFGAYNTLTAGRYEPGEAADEGWDLNNVEQGLENVYQFSVSEPNNKTIVVTLAWNRHYQKRYPFERDEEKDVDLKLELLAYDKNGNSFLLDYSDSEADNVEHIYIPADANYVNYEIVVSIADEANPESVITEDYGIAWRVIETDKQNDISWFDLNRDGGIDKNDIAVLLENASKFQRGSADYLIGDINNDGMIDVKDISMFARRIR